MLANFVLENANNPGTGTVSLAGPPAGRVGFMQAFATGATVYYYLDDGTQAEWGYGLLTAGAPATLARSTVLGTTAGNTTRLNFTGAVRVYNECPAERTAWLDINGILNPLTIPSRISSLALVSNLSAPSGTVTTLYWDTTNSDTLGIAGGAPSFGFTTATAGIYSVAFNVTVAGSGGGTQRTAQIMLGSSPFATMRVPPIASGNDLSVSWLGYLGPGTSVTARVYQDTGAALNVGGGNSNFSIVRLGG